MKQVAYEVKQDRQFTYNLASRHVRATIVAVEKSISITYSECVSVASSIQHAMRRIVICGLPHSTVQRDSKRWTQFRTSVFPELYMVCE